MNAPARGCGKWTGGGGARDAERCEKCCSGFPGCQTVAVGGGNHELQVRTGIIFQALQNMVTIYLFIYFSSCVRRAVSVCTDWHYIWR